MLAAAAVDDGDKQHNSLEQGKMPAGRTIDRWKGEKVTEQDILRMADKTQEAIKFAAAVGDHQALHASTGELAAQMEERLVRLLYAEMSWHLVVDDTDEQGWVMAAEDYA